VVAAALGLGDHVVDRLGGAEAVDAAAAVARENRTPGQADVRAVGDADEALEFDDERHRQLAAGAVEDTVAVLDTDGFACEDEDGGTPDGDDAQGLISRIQYEGCGALVLSYVRHRRHPSCASRSLRRGYVTIVTDGCAKRTTFFVLVLTVSEEFTDASPIVPEIPDM
jgi:hypothetical protein